MDIETATMMGLTREFTTSPHVERVSAPAIVQSALDALSQRAVIRDAPTGERSAKRAAAILTAWKGREWSEDDVWSVLFAVKMARAEQGAFHADDYIDLCGYAALMAECRAGLENA